MKTIRIKQKEKSDSILQKVPWKARGKEYGNISFLVFATVSMEEKSLATIKKTFIQNVIKFCIGAILLVICWVYVVDHPAEKISFFSWFRVIWQNVEITVANIFGENGEYLKQKYSLESYYEALITLAEGKPCVDPEIIKDLQKTYEELLLEPKSSLEHTLKKYVRKQMMFDQALNISC